MRSAPPPGSLPPDAGQIDTVEFAYVDGSEGVRTETFASEASTA